MTTLPFPGVTDKRTTALWQRVFRRGIAPQLSERALELLARALATDDARLLQGATTQPPPLPVCADWPIERAEPLALALWLERGLSTVGEVERAWAWACAECDRRLGAPLFGEFAHWWDSPPREVARRELLKEANRALRHVA